MNISNIERRVRAEFEDASRRIKDAANEVGGKVKEGFDNVSDSLKKKKCCIVIIINCINV